MKQVYLTITILALATASIAQSYSVFTAKKNGVWNDMSVWTITPRIDGVSKNKVIIPASYTITADNGVNSMGLGDMQIHVSGTLKLASNTTINLTNNSSIELVTSGKIDATSSSQKINIGSTVKYDGNKDKLKNGPSVADNSTGVSPLGFRSLALLPVTFVNFNVARINSDIRISWATSTEINNNRFEVERSLDGTNWNVIAMVLSAGTSTSISSYSYTDKNVTSPAVYYRVKQVDNDGQSKYTAVKTLKSADDIRSNTQIFATSGKMVTVKFEQPKQNVVMKIMNMNGQIVKQQTIANTGNSFSVKMNDSDKGLYVVQITDSENNSDSKKIILN